MRRRSRPLRKHQRTAFEYAKTEHPALFMEMRLGKTLVVIRRCATYRPREPHLGLRVLIVAPNSALGSWEDELTTENIDWIRLLGTSKKRFTLLDEGVHEETEKPRYILTNKESHSSVPEMGDVKWDAVVLDESQFIKNPKTATTKFYTREFRDVPHRWVLTGTPNPEGDQEFFTQMLFLHGDFMGFKNYYGWQNALFIPHPAGFGWLPKSLTRKKIQKAVGERALVMRRRDVGVEKHKVEEVRWLNLPAKVRKEYDSIENEFASESTRTKWAGAKFQWLRQLCGGFGVEGDLVHKEKTSALTELITGELAREQVVVWFNYNAELREATKILQKKVKVMSMTGETPPTLREKYRRAFQAGKIRVLCIQQAIAQTGMNLSASDTAIYFSQPASYLAWKQTQDRILDLGQDSSLLLLYLVIRESVDEDIHHALREKGVNSDRTLNKAVQARQEARTRARSG